MNYPNKKQTNNTLQKIKSNSNRGMNLEEDLNVTNEYYLNNDIANIHKKPTPIQVVDVSYPSREKCMITKAFYKVPSTTDYNGIYKGKYIDFEAKETKSKTSFPLRNIHDHQIEHLKSITKHGGIGFLIISFTEYGECFLVMLDFVLKYVDGPTKSIPYKDLKENCPIIKYGYMPRLDYLSVLEGILKINF